MAADSNLKLKPTDGAAAGRFCLDGKMSCKGCLADTTLL
jgi:hypothetical protein